MLRVVFASVVISSRFSIRQHEEKVMLCCELGNKILRTDTVLDQMAEARKRGSSSFKVTAEKFLLGAIVMTR